MRAQQRCGFQFRPVLLTRAVRPGPLRAIPLSANACGGRRRRDEGWRGWRQGGQAEARVRGVGELDSREIRGAAESTFGNKPASSARSVAVASWYLARGGIVNLTRSSRPSWPLSLERGQAYRRAKDFSAPNAAPLTAGGIPPPLKLTM